MLDYYQYNYNKKRFEWKMEKNILESEPIVWVSENCLPKLSKQISFFENLRFVKVT